LDIAKRKAEAIGSAKQRTELFFTSILPSALFLGTINYHL
jgi:hypothetical protein